MISWNYEEIYKNYCVFFIFLVMWCFILFYYFFLIFTYLFFNLCFAVVFNFRAIGNSRKSGIFFILLRMKTEIAIETEIQNCFFFVICQKKCINYFSKGNKNVQV